MWRWIAVGVMVGAGGCGLLPGTDGTVCTTAFIYGVNVRVVDEDGEEITGAELTLEEGDFSETLEEMADGQYVGAGERAGTYTLTVEAEGFETETVEDIVVDENECHVIPVIRTITLTASEAE
jgi:hypothetical protein